MSELILNWLNDQIQLSKRINSFEEDFNNGYLFGELLSKYNQQLNFAEFLNKDDKKSKLKNFQLLFDTFSALRVTFNSSVANEIINKKSGVAKKLLYELKMNLQKTLSASMGGNAFTKMTKMTKTLSPLKKIKVSKEQYDKVDKQHFVKQLNQLHPAQKSINQEKLLKKFSDFHERQVVTNNQLSQKQYDGKLSEQRKFRQRQRDNLKKTADFRNQWQRSNVQKWQANMTVRHIQNDKDTMFKTKLQQTKFQNKTMSELNAIKSMDKDINDFQKKFLKGANKKNKITQIQDSDQSDEANNTFTHTNAIPEQSELKKKQSKLQSKLKFTSGSSPKVQLDSSKTKKFGPQNQQQKHQREKKRRKMIVEQNKRYQLIEISRRQKYILSTIQQTSKQQKELEYEIWRVWQNKEVIKQNKNLQQEKEKEKNEVRQINAKFKRDELLKTYRQQHEVQVNESVLRQQKLLKDHAVAQRKNIYQDCKKIVEQFLTVTEQLFMNQQQTNSLELSPHLVDHLFSEFVEGVTQKKEIAELEVKNYIKGNGEWNIKPQRKILDQPTEPTQDNALPQHPVNNFYLGNILRFLYENKFTFKKSQQSDNQSIPSSSQYLISLIGPQFSGKHIAASSLQQNHNFNIIQIEKLIFRKIQQYEQIKGRVSEISEDTQKIAQLAYAGQDIPNQLIIKLIQEEVTKNPRSVLLNFPISYNQALSLTKQLSGVQPSDFIPKSEFDKKVESFSRLVWPTQSKIVPKPIRQCGVDLALWVDIPDKQSYDRFLGRRWIDGKIVNIHDDVADNVRRLEVGDKSTPQILKNYKKLVQKQNIKQFFNQFGIQVKALQPEIPKQVEQFKEGQKVEQQVQKQNYSHQILKSWAEIDGKCSIQQLQKRVLQKIDQAMKIKTKKRGQLAQEELMKKKIEDKKVQNQKKQEELKQKCVFTERQILDTKLTNALQSSKLPQQFISQTISAWQSTQSSTITSFKHCFEFLTLQKSTQNDYISQTKRNFINMLTRDDKKFSMVKKFQIDYNQFLDQNKQMISQQFTKEELHQRVDDLEEELFDIIEQKKQDAIQEKKSNSESGWLESQLQQFYHIVRILLQAELNRYNCSQKILNDFYSKRYAVSQNPTQDNSALQINYDTTLEMITKQGLFPRLQKILSQTLRLFNREQEVVDDKGKKGGKAPPPKKDDKKGGKKVQVQEPKQPSPQELQLKKAINIEKSIFRYRVSVISEFSQQKLSQFVKNNDSLYKQLESYYLYTYDIENKCVSNLSKIFRKNIELQKKIQNQIAVEYVDVIENEKIRNFQKQKPIILPAKQQKLQNRLTVANALQLIQLLRNEAESKQKLSTKRLIQILKYLKNNLTQKQILPSNWKSLEDQKIERFVNNLDSESLGSVQLWKIIVFIVLTNCSIPTNKELEQYYNELTAFGTVREVQREKFISSKVWFDDQYTQIENVRTFRRNQQIKEILFQLFKYQKGLKQYVQAQNVCKSLGLYEWLVIQDFGSGKTYFDLAFVRE